MSVSGSGGGGGGSYWSTSNVLITASGGGGGGGQASWSMMMTGSGFSDWQDPNSGRFAEMLPPIESWLFILRPNGTHVGFSMQISVPVTGFDKWFRKPRMGYAVFDALGNMLATIDELQQEDASWTIISKTRVEEDIIREAVRKKNEMVVRDDPK